MSEKTWEMHYREKTRSEIAMHYPHFPSELEARSKRAWQSRKTISNIQFTVNIHLLYICSSSGLILFSFVNNNGVSLCQEKKEIGSVDRYKGKEREIYLFCTILTFDWLFNQRRTNLSRTRGSLFLCPSPPSISLSLSCIRAIAWSKLKRMNERTNERSRAIERALSLSV